MDFLHHYREQGEGEPLILLHGNGENGGYFERQFEAFSKDYRVIAPDTRGHGKTPRGDAPFTIRQFADDLRDFLDRLNLGKAHLLGFSDGANIAMIFAMRYPERVDKLILNGGNLNPGGVKRRFQIPIGIGYRIAKHFAKKDPRAKARAELLGLMVNDPDIVPDDLAQIQAPTLVIAGTRDMIRSSHTRLIARKIPNAKQQWIKGDHFIAARNPDEFNRAVAEFLKK